MNKLYQDMLTLIQDVAEWYPGMTTETLESIAKAKDLGSNPDAVELWVVARARRIIEATEKDSHG